MCFQIDRVGDDSELGSFNSKSTSNEPRQIFRPVAGSGNALLLCSNETSQDRTGFSFPCVEWGWQRFPFDGFPEKESDWREIETRYDNILAWLGYWRSRMPDEAVSRLQDILGVPPE